MADQDVKEKYCRGCGKPIAGYGGDEPRPDGDLYCPQCMIERAEKYIKEEEPAEKSKLQRLRETMGWKIALAMVLCVCLVIIVYQTPRILKSLEGPQPIRMGGTYATDATTDKCINNLWQLVYDLQQGKKGTVGQTLVCPASGKPYKIIPGANQEVHCPNPRIHGFRDIVVSKKNPVPELKK
jgi:hypothetical protein